MGGAVGGADPARRVRSWPWVLALLVGAPFLAETVASSNTPLVLFPVVLPLYAVVYGAPALLVRELWVRGRLTAPRLLAAGVASTAVNEGVVAATWFKLSDQGEVLSFTAAQAGRAGGVNWAVLVGLVVFHTVWSTALPVLLLEAVAVVRGSPVSGRPWLRRRGVVVALVLLALLVLGSLTPDGTAETCAGPVSASCAAGRVGAAVLAVGLTVVLLVLGVRARPVPELLPAAASTVRPLLGGLVFAVVFFAGFFLLTSAGHPEAAVLVHLVLLVLVGLRASSWCRPGPGPTVTQVAAATGALLPGAAASLLAWRFGQPVGAAVAVGAVVVLLRRTRRSTAD